MEINGKTRLFGLIGNPVENSLSPAMHNAAFERLKLDYRYVCFNIEEGYLPDAINSMRALNIIGMNVTVPYKQKAMQYLDEIDHVAKKIGAVNTIVNRDGELIGYNTDWSGAILSIEEIIKIRNKKIVLLGAGGAGRSIAYGITKNQGKLTILNRTVEKAIGLANEFGCEYGSLELLGTIKGDLLINATGIGLKQNGIKDNKPFATVNQLKNFKVVFDISYIPFETDFLINAKKAGCKTIPGLKMLAYQGAASFELFTGKKISTDFMFDAAKKELSKKK